MQKEIYYKELDHASFYGIKEADKSQNLQDESQARDSGLLVV